jgi:hypothetical protein
MPGMFDEYVRRQRAPVKAEAVRDEAYRAQSRVDAERAVRRLLAILRGAQPSRDLAYDPGPQPGMLPLAGLRDD